jgi:hypothetical protein
MFIVATICDRQTDKVATICDRQTDKVATICGLISMSNNNENPTEIVGQSKTDIIIIIISSKSNLFSP